MRNTKYSLKTLLFILSGLLITFTTVIMTLYHYRYSTTILRKEFVAKAEIIAKSTGHQSYEGIIIQDPYIFREICQAILRERNMRYVMVYNDKGVLIYDQFKEGFTELAALYSQQGLKTIKDLHESEKKQVIQFKKKHKPSFILDVRRAVKDKTEPYEIIGYIRIGLSLHEIKKMEHELIANSCFITLIILVIGLIISFLLSKEIGKSLSVVGEAMKKIIQSDDLSEQIKRQSKIAEVNGIQDHFNTMIENLRVSRHNLEESKDRYQTLVATASKAKIGIALIQNNSNRTGLFKYVNQYFADVTGYSIDDLLTMTIEDIIHPENCQKMRKLITESFSRKEGKASYHFLGINKKGKNVPIEISAGVTEFDGKKGLVFYAKDITEKLKAEKKLENYSQNLEKMVKKRTAELEQAFMDLKKTQSQLIQSEKLASIGQLAAGIAHEINTPTQYAGDNVRFLRDAFNDLNILFEKYVHLPQTLKEGMPVEELVKEVNFTIEETDLDYLKDEIPRAIEQTLEGMERISEIVRSMKEFSHPGVKDKTAVDINRAIETTITVSRNEWKYVSEMETDLDPSLPLVPCLPGELNQVFLNLIINAAQAIADKTEGGSAGKGIIRISTRKDGHYVEIRFSDTGTGIPEEIHAKIFEPFFTTKEVGAGTGQGLAISRSVIVEKHGGDLWFETESGKGTTFIIRLPVAEEAV
ncbi:MAG: ATP-binding protein [Thermodesulfobacteriota bacterium]